MLMERLERDKVLWLAKRAQDLRGFEPLKVQLTQMQRSFPS